MPDIDAPPRDANDPDNGISDMKQHWLRRPHPAWVIGTGAFLAVLTSMCGAPSFELYIDLVSFKCGGIGLKQAIINERFTPNSTVAFTTLSAPAPFPGIDPVLCRKDVGVQRSVAKMFMYMGIMRGILTMMTAPSWSTLSDRVGRCKIIALSAFGTVVQRGSFLFVCTWPHLVKPWIIPILFAGDAFTCLLGGGAALNPVSSAYMTDISSDNNFSTLFAVANGIERCGAIVGPLIGAAMITKAGSLLLPFQIAFGGYIVWLVAVLSVMPESLSAEAMTQNRTVSVVEVENEDSWLRRWAARILQVPKRVIDALKVLAPPPRGPLGHKDYNVTLLALTSFVIKMSWNDGGLIAEYSMFAFGWDYSNFAPLNSASNFTSTVLLLGVIPLLSRFGKPLLVKLASRGRITDETTPLLSEGSAEATVGTVTGPQSEVDADLSHRVSLTFDRLCLLGALFAACVGSGIMGTNAGGTVAIFLCGYILTIVISPGPSFTQALALELAPESVTAGQLFGAIGLVDTFASTFAAPVLYTTVYSHTLDFYPETIFLVALATWMAAIAAVIRVRVPALRT